MKKFCLLALLSVSLFSFDKVGLGYGYHDTDIKAYEITAFKDLDYKLFDTFKLGVELSYSRVITDANEDLHSVALVPMLTYDFNKTFYVEAGVGPSYISDYTISNEHLGMHFQFKDFVALGANITDRLSADVRFTHYSNAHLNENNTGLDLGVISLRYQF